MHLNFDAVYQGVSKFADENRKTQTADIGFFSTSEICHFDALTHNLYFCAYSGSQPLIPAEPGVKNS